MLLINKNILQKTLPLSLSNLFNCWITSIKQWAPSVRNAYRLIVAEAMSSLIYDYVSGFPLLQCQGWSQDAVRTSGGRDKDRRSSGQPSHPAWRSQVRPRNRHIRFRPCDGVPTIVHYHGDSRGPQEVQGRDCKTSSMENGTRMKLRTLIGLPKSCDFFLQV